MEERKEGKAIEVGTRDDDEGSRDRARLIEVSRDGRDRKRAGPRQPIRTARVPRGEGEGEGLSFIAERPGSQVDTE
jgi:hypothetical protein